MTAFTFTAPMWLWSAQDSWHFVTVPPEISDQIAEATAGLKRGFGSVPVTVTVGETTWKTSIFPSKTEAAYVLPVKKAVRDAEGLELETPVAVELVVALKSS